MHSVNFIDLLVISIFLVLCLGIGVYRARGVKTLQQFALGYQNVTIVVLATTIFASSIGTNSTIMAVGNIYMAGIIYAIVKIIQSFRWVTTAYIFGANIENFKGCLSVSHIMHKLYGNYARVVTSIAALIICLGLVAVQAIAIGELFHYFFGLDRSLTVIVSCAIFTFYSALGGIRSVILTEVFKFAVFAFILQITYTTLFIDAGNFSASVLPNLPESHTVIDWTRENIISLISLSLIAILPEYSAPFIQRCLIANNAKQLLKTLRFVTYIYIIFSLSTCLLAYIAKAFFPEVDPNHALFYYVAQLVPPFLKGIMLAGLLATMMSMAEAHLSAVSIIIVNDIIKPLFPNILAKQELFYVRVSIVVLSIISIALALSGQGILELIRLIFNFWHPLILVPISAGFLGFRTSPRSFMASIIASLITVIAIRVYSGKFSELNLFAGIIASGLGLFGMHYYQLRSKIIRIEGEMTIITPHLITDSIKLLRDAINSYKSIGKYVVAKFTDSRINITHFCTFTLSCYFIYSLSVDSTPGYKQLGYMISIGYTLCLILIFRNFLFSERLIKKYVALYYNILLTYCLPFVSSYMMFVSNDSNFWVINALIVASALFYIIDTSRMLLFYSIGVLGGYIAFTLTDVPNYQDFFISNTMSVVLTILSFLFISLFFARRKEREQNEREGNLQLLGGAIAHEVKSPIAAMKMTSDNVSVILLEALSNAKPADKHGKVTLKIDQETLEFLSHLTHSLGVLGTKGIKTVDGILTTLKSAVVAEDKEIYPILTCVNEAVIEYKGCHPDSKMEIEIKKGKFDVYGSKHYIIHVIVNLLKNAFNYAGGNKARVVISVKKSEASNELHIKDYGQGIAKEDIEKIFERYYTKSQTGTGIGLAFCRMVIEDLGGSIKCKSVVGKYTNFILTFPRISPV